MKKNIKLCLLIVFVFIFNTSIVFGYNISCDDIETVRIYFYQAELGDNKHQQEDKFFIPFFFLYDDPAKALINYLMSQSSKGNKIFINNKKILEIPEYSHDYTETMAKTKVRYFTGMEFFSTYEKALQYTEQYCPNKIMRGKENVLTEWPE